MLKFFRKNARGWFMLVFMAIIIFVFVLYFGTDRGSRSANAIAVIDGTVVTEAEFANEHSKILDILKERYGGALSADIIKQMDPKKMAYENIINRQIIIAKAKDLKIQVSDDELKQMIMSMPALQTDGRFDGYKYKQLLRFNRMTAQDFESDQKINMAAGKIEAIIREGIKVSDREVLDLYTLQNQKINLGYVQISGANMKAPAPSADELESYLKKNPKPFRVPERVKIDYLFFDSSSYASADISSSDIQSEYNRNKESYKSKEGKLRSLDDVKESIIQNLKKSRGMQAANDAAKKARLAIYEGKETFESFAGKNNLNVQAFNEFALNQPPQELAAINNLDTQLAEMEKNDISKVLQAGNGYYLLRLKEKKPAYTPQLKDIEQAVTQSFINNERNQLAVREAEAIAAKLQKGSTLEQLAEEKGLQIQETGMFSPGSEIPKLGSHPEAMEMLQSLSMKHPYASKPLNINNAQVIFKLKEQSALDMKDFESKKDVYRKIATNFKREEALKSWLEGNKAAMIKSKRLKIKKEAKDL